MNYHKPDVLSTLQSYGPEYQQFREAIKEATVEELEKALTVISQKSRVTRITAELNRRKKGKGGAL
ncbi:MAG: hypothetical protein J6B04_05640 [Clostridia bacterium]|nr:hypothetical protein [Clostridia bacterium]